MTNQIGFIGLGLMGMPIARNIAAAGIPLVVWNRSSEKYRELSGLPVTPALSSSDVFQQSSTIFTVLANAQILDEILERGTGSFKHHVAGKLLVNMGTTSAEYSRLLNADIMEAGGRYIEAPVSGSRIPAERGELVVMLAGNRDDANDVAAILEPAAKEAVYAGAVPSALVLKLSVNLFLITMVTGLLEASQFAKRQGVDAHLLQRVLNAGPMASPVSKAKLELLAADDFAPQASIKDVLMNANLVLESAKSTDIPVPLLEAAREIFHDADKLGLGAIDMAGAIEAYLRR